MVSVNCIPRKLYVREPESAELSAFVRKLAPPLPFSSLHELELTHALERRRAEGDLTTILSSRAASDLPRNTSAQIFILPNQSRF